jgi:hypothetical protein
MSGTAGPALNPGDPRAGDPTKISTWVTIGGAIIVVVVIGTVTLWNGGKLPVQPSPSANPPASAAVSTPSFGDTATCNPGDVKLTVHLYGHSDIGMTFKDATSSDVQTSWPAGNAPFPNSFPRFPAPWLRYGCFHAGTQVHLTFNNSDEPWSDYSRTVGGGCDVSRPLTVGRAYSPAELSAPVSCDVGLQSADVEINAYWAEPSFVNGALAGFAEFPACLPGGTAGYCPPAGS